MPSYTVTLEKNTSGWRAWCQALPECHGHGKNQKQAYAAIKGSIRGHIRQCIRRGKSVPLDRTTTKFFRLDISALKEPPDLR